MKIFNFTSLSFTSTQRGDAAFILKMYFQILKHLNDSFSMRMVVVRFLLTAKFFNEDFIRFLVVKFVEDWVLYFPF